MKKNLKNKHFLMWIAIIFIMAGIAACKDDGPDPDPDPDPELIDIEVNVSFTSIIKPLPQQTLVLNLYYQDISGSSIMNSNPDKQITIDLSDSNISDGLILTFEGVPEDEEKVYICGYVDINENDVLDAGDLAVFYNNTSLEEVENAVSAPTNLAGMESINLDLNIIYVGVEPEIEEVWNLTAGATGSAPEWMSNNEQRDMVYHNGRLYIPSRKGGNKIVVIDAETGQELSGETIELPADQVFGGVLTLNGISVTPSGKILVSNLVTNSSASNFKVYLVEPNGGSYNISTIIDWNSSHLEDLPGFRLGDPIASYGDLTPGSNGYIIIGNVGSLHVIRWDIQNGTVAEEPVIFEVEGVYPPHDTPRFHFAPIFQPVDMNRFLVNSSRMYPTLYDMTGKILSSFTGIETPKAFGISGVTHFTYKDRAFVVCATTNYLEAEYPPSAFEVFEIRGGPYNFNAAKSLGIIPEQGMGGIINNVYYGSTAVSVQPDGAYMYLMTPNNGIACYKLSIE